MDDLTAFEALPEETMEDLRIKLAMARVLIAGERMVSTISRETAAAGLAAVRQMSSTMRASERVQPEPVAVFACYLDEPQAAVAASSSSSR